MRMWAVAAINGYQRHLSPRKGFRCAHRVRHGGDSCSQFAKRAIADGGIWAGWLALRLRFRECRAAARILRAEAQADSSEPVNGNPPRRAAGNAQTCNNVSDSLTCCFGLEACGELGGLCGGCG